MKTITEMQAQIKEMSSKLDEFARDLSDYNQTEGQKELVDFKQIKAIGSRNPIKGHILVKADNSIKKKYLTMLISLAYLAKEKQECAWLLIQRIASGSGFAEELMDLSVDAANITDAQIDDFTLAIAAAKLTDCFVLDSMLIYLCYESANEDMMKFMTSLFELVRCGKTEVRELAELAKAIAGQSEEAYLEFRKKRLKIKAEDFNCYTTFLPYHDLINDPTILYVFEYGDSFSEFVKKIDKKYKIVVFEKLTVSESGFEVENFQKVVFNKCRFKDIHGTSRGAISFNENQVLEIKHCTFKDISDCVLEFKHNQTAIISDCIFKNISGDDGFLTYIGPSATLHLIDNPISKMTRCILENIKGNYSLYCKGTSPTITNCTSKNCSRMYNISGIKQI